MGPSQISSLTVRLTSVTDNKSEVKGKLRVLSELREDANSKLGNQPLPVKAETSAPNSLSSDGQKSVNCMLSQLSSLSKVMDAASKVQNELSSYLSGY